MNLTTGQGWRYGLLGLPLAFVALPLYVLLPNHYARTFGAPLASLGLLLLVTRLLDAAVDPWLGRLSDRLFARSSGHVLALGGAAALLMAGGFTGLFLPPVNDPQALLTWAAVALAVTYPAYSALSVAHQSWGARLGGDAVQRSRVVAWREGFSLAGVLLAAFAAAALGIRGLVALFFIAMTAGWLAWTRAPRPTPGTGAQPAGPGNSLLLPLRRPAFRALLAVFTVNGIASAVPATLMLFFVQDRLQASASAEPLFLACYFLSAVLALPLWLALVRRIGLARTWLCGMVLAIAVFVFAAGLGSGDTLAFAIVCALSGAALGTDLVLPAALLTGVIANAGDQGHAEGAYFGWWAFAGKLNLALAAGLALPALAALGYTPGARDPAALQALVAAYCVLPCVLKLIAASGLYVLIDRTSP